MAETKNQEESTLHTKRQLDLKIEDGEEKPKKAQKLETLDNSSSVPLGKSEECEATPKSSSNLEVPNSNCSSVTEERIEKVESGVIAKEGGNEDGEEDNEVDNDDEDDGEDEYEDEDGEESNGKAQVDRKGKGKLIEEADEDEDDSDDDDDDSSVYGGVSDGDGDLSDDPLAEVDLNNILPSRTRGRIIHPDVYIANDLGNEEEEEEEEDSNGSDA